MKPFTLPTFTEPDELVADAAASPWSIPLLAAQHSVAAAGADLDALLDAASSSALAIIPSAEGALVALRTRGRLVCRAATGTAAPLLGQSLTVDALTQRCLAEARLLHCDDALHDGRVDRAACARRGIRSLLLVPLPFRGETGGLLILHASAANAFDARARLAAQLLAGVIALGLAAAPAPPAPPPADRVLGASFERAPVALAHVSPTGAFLAANARFRSIAGRTREALARAGLRDLADARALDGHADEMDALLDGRIEHFEAALTLIHENGNRVAVRLGVGLVRDTAGQPDFLLLAAEPLIGAGAAGADAPHDPVTGLLGAAGLVARLERELDRAANDGQALTLALLDLGGEASPACLETVARALERACRPGDAVARLRGATFALVLPGLERKAAAGPLRRARAAAARAALKGGCETDCAIGAASRLRDGATPASLLVAAETRLAAARIRGRSGPA